MDSYFHYGDVIVKKYREDKFRLIGFHYPLRGSLPDDLTKDKPVRGTVNDDKLDQSLQRSRRTIREIADCNDFDLFVTMTLDPKKYDRKNLDVYRKTFLKWVNNANSRKGYDIAYLIIPEYHKDKECWHIHALMMGIPHEKLEPFDTSKPLPISLLKKLKHGDDVRNWPDYAEKFGHVTVEMIRDKEACAGYIAKYITKDVLITGIELNQRIYYCSKGLNRPTEIMRGETFKGFKADYSNEFVSIRDVASMDEVLPLIHERAVSTAPVWIELEDDDIPIERIFPHILNRLNQPGEQMEMEYYDHDFEYSFG